MSNLKRLLENLLTEGYYGKDEFKSLEDTISRWQIKGDKMYDEDVHAFVKLEDILPYKEYERSREDGRNSPEEWDKLMADMEAGWNPKKPAHVLIGKQGGTKVGEGNHRLAIAKQLGIQEIPVQFHFVWDKVVKDKVPELYRESIGRKYYHITPAKNVSKILKNGLDPKKPQDYDDEEGVYLFKSKDDVDDALMNWLGDRFDEDEDLALLEIDGNYVKRVSPGGAGYEVIVKHAIPAEAIKLSRSLLENKEIDPEDYRIAHRAPGKEDNSPIYDMSKTYPDDFYTLPIETAARYYGTGEGDDELLVGIIRRLHNRPNDKVTIFRAVSKAKGLAVKIAEYEEKKRAHLRRGRLPLSNKMSHEEARAAQGGKSSWYDFISNEIERLQRQLDTKGDPSALNITRINPGDWITITKKYAVEHGEGALGGEYKILTKTVPAKTLWTNGDSLYEFGYNP